jgi:AraC family transcriptional regulator of adaptative response / DNA-3-methyladenine glycosylase II
VRCTATLASVADIAPLVSRVRRLLDLDADARAIDEALGADPVLAPLVAATPGIRLPGSVDPAETLVRVLLDGRPAVLARLVALLGDPLPPALAGAGVSRIFPSSAVIAADGDAVLGRSVDTVRRVCGLLADGSLGLDAGASREELSERLLAVPGVSARTAVAVAMRVTGDPDVLQTEQRGVRRGAIAVGLGGAPLALAAAGRRWAPWRSYAGEHLRRAADDPRRATGPRRAG